MYWQHQVSASCFQASNPQRVSAEIETAENIHNIPLSLFSDRPIYKWSGVALIHLYSNYSDSNYVKI